MLQEDKRKQLDDIVQKMISNKESDNNIQLVVNDFKSKYDVPETQVASKSPFLAQPAQKTAQDFGRQPIDVSKKEIGVTDYLKSAGRGLLAGGFNTLSNVASVAKPFFPDTGKFSGGDFLNKVQDLKYVAKDLNNQNMQEAIRTRQPQLAGTSNVGQLLGGEIMNPINYIPIPGGSGLKGRLLRGGINAVQGQISYNKDLNPASRLETAATDLGFGTLMPADIGKSISNLVKKASPLAKGRVENAIGKMFPEQNLATKTTDIISGFKKAGQPKAENKAIDIAGKILGGNKDIKPETIKAITELPINEIKSQEGFKNAINTRIKNLAEQMDSFVNKNYPEKTPIANYSKEVALSDGSKLAKNDITDALDNLEELYTNSGDITNQARISELRNKAMNEGMAKQEINDLAREYGVEFKSKAFSKKGDPLTSVSAQKFENTRQGLKDVFREGLPKDIVNYDKRMSGLYDARMNVEKNITKVNEFKRKLVERGLIEKVGEKIFNFIDLLSLGTAKGMTKGLLKSFAPGFSKNSFNALEIEGLLNKNLKNLVKEVKKAGIDPTLPELKAIEEVIQKPNYSLQRGLGVQTPPIDTTKRYSLERSSNVDFNANELASNRVKDARMNQLNKKIEAPKNTDYKKLASEMKMSITPTQSRVKAVKKLNPTKSQGLKPTTKIISDNILKSKEGADIFQELDIAKAGSRYWSNNGIMDSGLDTMVVEEKSTFPKWIPSYLRKSEYLKKIKQNILDKTYPKSKPVQELYEVIKKELDKRLDIPF